MYFDLGINGDYEGMYAWLDDHGARACGEHLAFVRYEFFDDLFNELNTEIRTEIDILEKNHIYVIYKDDAGNVVGKFLVGKRVKAPWIGYGSAEEEEAVDES